MSSQTVVDVLIVGAGNVGKLVVIFYWLLVGELIILLLLLCFLSEIGHNGLVAAALLAKQGLNVVCVFCYRKSIITIVIVY